MKIRNDFVTNSSSYSSCVIQIDNPVLEEILIKYKNASAFCPEISNAIETDDLSFSTAEHKGCRCPNKKEEILESLLDYIKYISEFSEWQDDSFDRQSYKSFLHEVELHKDEIAKAYKKALFVVLDESFGDSVESRGSWVYRFPAKQPMENVEIGDGSDKVFAYAAVDSYPAAGIILDETLKRIKGKTFDVVVGKRIFSVKFNVTSGCKTIFSNYIENNAAPTLFDYYLGKEKQRSFDAWVCSQDHGLAEELYIKKRLTVFEELPALSASQIKHRVGLFIDAVERSITEEFANYAQKYVPKKKNGGFSKKNAYILGVLPCVDDKKTCYAYYLKAKNDKELLISLKKTSLKEIMKSVENKDFFESTNLFKDLSIIEKE